MPLKKFIRSLSLSSSSSSSSKSIDNSQQDKTNLSSTSPSLSSSSESTSTTKTDATTTTTAPSSTSTSVWGRVYQDSFFLIPAEAPGSHSYNNSSSKLDYNNSKLGDNNFVVEEERAIAIAASATTAATATAKTASSDKNTNTSSMCMSTTTTTSTATAEKETTNENTTTTTVDPPFERCREILEYYSVKAQQPDQADACKLIDEYITTGQEGGLVLESAAQSSYAYWYYKKHCSRQEDTSNLPRYRRAAAAREANRHLEGETFEDAIGNLKKTIEFHTNNKTASYRELALSKDSAGSSSSSSSSSSCSPERRMVIEEELCNSHKFCVRGHDREDRAVIFAHPRKKASANAAPGDDVKSFVETIVYTMSRAIACSEFTSGGHQEKIVCVIDARGSSAPSMKACKEGVQILQKHFPGRLKNLVFLNPPFFLMTLYNMIKPFLDPETKSKFIIVKSDKAKIAEISKLVDVSQAMPTMLPGGILTSEVDAKTYLYDVPFHRLYDDRTENQPQQQQQQQQQQQLWQQDKEEQEVFDHSTATTETNATSTSTFSTTNPYFVVDGEGADDSYNNNNIMRSPLVKKPSFIKSIAVGEIRNPDLAAAIGGGDNNDGDDDGLEEFVATTVVDAVRS